MISSIRSYSLYFAWLIAIFGTLGSLYFGEVSGQEPCALCWYQRICLFPLVFILGVAAYKEDERVWHYVIYQVILGALFSTYQLVKDLFHYDLPLCGPAAPCESIQVFGDVPFPFLSLLAFISILFLVLFNKK